MDNYAAVVHQLGEFLAGFGHEFRSKDLPLVIDSPKSKGCGTKGKYWYKLHSFRPDSGGSLITGSFGKYGSDQREKVAIDWKPINEAERARQKAERDAKTAENECQRQQLAEFAAMGAVELWSRASKTGTSPYLTKKGVVGECCRFLPDGSIVVPLLRYDLPRDQALRAVQTIYPDGAKRFTKGFLKAACAVRLGDVLPGYIVLICEGYVTGLTLRMACPQSLAVYVALDAGNLQHVVPLVRQLHPASRILIAADDDWRTRDPITKKLNNPGRAAAKQAATHTNDVDVVYPIFNATTRGDKDTDYNDLHTRQGLEAVSRQLRIVVSSMRSIYG